MPVAGGASLRTRVGIASGNVVIGDIIGSGLAREASIAGETPHLAARLQAAAAPNEVLASDATHHMVGALFGCRSADISDARAMLAARES